MKNYDPNIRLGTHTIKVSFQRWDYKGFVTFRRGGNCKGLDVLALDEDDLYDQTLTDNPIGFGLLPEDDEGNELSYFPLFTSNEQIDKWGIKDNVELKEGQILISECRPFDQHIATFFGAGEYDALLINPFDQAFVIGKEFIKAISGHQEEDETPAA